MNEENKAEKKKSLSPAMKMLIASLLLVAAALVQHFVFGMVGVVEARQDLIMTDTEVTISYGFDMQASFYSPGARHFFFSARDGMQNMSSTGELRWQEAYDMVQPLMIGRGDKVAVGEPGGRSIYVFNAAGLLYTADLPHPVLYFTVNPTGFLSTILQTDSGYMIKVFNPSNPNDPDYGYRAVINDANIFPFSVDVSDCGTFVAKAFWDVNTLMFSRLTFGFFRGVDSRGMHDGFFASNSFPDEFIYRIRFTSGGRKLLVLSDQQIIGFTVEDGSREKAWSIPLYNRPELFTIGENHFAFVTGDPFLNEPNAKNPGVLHIYDFNGRPTGTYNLGRRATHLHMGFNAILVGTGRTFYAINTNGTRKWTYSAIHDVQDMIFLDNTDTVLLAGGARATVMRRLR